MAKKEPKEKKAKPPKEKKVKKGKGPAEEEILDPEQGEGKKGGLPRLLLLLSVLVIFAAVAIIVIFVVLPKMNGDAPPEGDPEPSDTAVYYDLPESFSVGELTVPAPVPLIAANVQAVKSVRVVYTYVDLTDSGAETANYVSKLVSEEKFYVVDEEFVRTDAPDFTTEEGEVLLAKNLPKPEKTDEPAGSAAPASSDEPGTSAEPAASATPSAPPQEEAPDMVLTVRVTWQPGMFVIASDQEEGKVTSPPRTPGAGVGGGLSVNRALDYIRGLPPSVLGLSGESMDSYRVYAMEGTVMVNGQTCMRMKVYSRNEVKDTNEFVGTYLLSKDGKRLYLLNESTDDVTELKLP